MKTPLPIQTDVRENLPSASGMERLYLCRGSHNLESQVTDIYDKTFADSGTRIHNALAGNLEPDLLNDDERWVYDRCGEHEQQLLESVFGLEKAQNDELKIYREKREWLLSEDDEKQGSGELDVIAIDEKNLAGLIDDYKTGYKPVTAPESNIQMRTYAVLAFERYGLLKVTVAVIQPRCTPPTALAVYEESDLRYAAQELRVVIAESKDPKAKRTPGPTQCEYCRAKGICPELKAQMKTESIEIRGVMLITNKEMDYREELMPGYVLSGLLDKVAHIERACKAVKDEVKLRIKAGRDVPGYALVKGRQHRTVTDQYGLYEKVVNKLKWMSPKEFWNNFTKVSIGDIDKLAKKHPPRQPNISPERLFNKRFGEFIESRSTEMALEKVAHRGEIVTQEKVSEVQESARHNRLKEIPQNSTLSQLFGNQHGKKSKGRKTA